MTQGRRLTLCCRLAKHEADASTRNPLQRPANPRGRDLGAASLEVRYLERRWLTLLPEHEQDERGRATPGVISDGLDIPKHQFRLRPVEGKPPQTLCPVGLDTNHGNVTAIWCHRRGVLRLGSVGHLTESLGRDLVPVNVAAGGGAVGRVGFASAADGGEEYRLPIGRKRWLIVIPRAVRDVDGLTDLNLGIAYGQRRQKDLSVRWGRRGLTRQRSGN